MASYGIDATKLSDPSLSAASNIRKPTADESGMPMLGIAGQAAGLIGDAVEGYAKAGLEKEQEKVTAEYIASKQNPAIAANAMAEMGAADIAEESLWARVAGDANYSPDVADFSGVQKSLDSSLQKYKTAMEQGVMTPDQFMARSLSATREAVNRTPGLYNELVGHAQKVLDMSGMTDILKSDIADAKSKAKKEADLQDYFLQQAAKHNVPITFRGDGSINMGQVVGEVQKIQKEQQLVEQADNFTKINTSKDEALAREFMSTNGMQLMTGKVNDVLNKGISLIGQGSDYQGAITQIRLGLNMARQDYALKLAPIANDPRTKSALEYLDKQTQIVEDVLSKAGSKEDLVKLSNNLSTVMRNDQYSEVSKYMNPEALKQITSLMSTAGAAHILDKNPQLMGAIMKTLGNVFSGSAAALGTDYTLRVGSDNAISLGIAHIAKQAATDPSAVPVLQKALDAAAQDVRNPDVIKTQDDKYRFYEKLMKDLGTPEVKIGMGKLDASAYSNVAGMLDDYMTMTTPAMQKSYLKWLQQGTELVLDALPDGRVIWKSSNPAAARDMNSRYTTRINDSLAAMSNLMNLDTKSVAVEHFFPNYLPQWADDKDLEALNIQSKGDADKALAAGKITPAQHGAILRSGF